MKKIILFIQMVLLVGVAARAQDKGYEKLAQDLFNAFKYNDTALYTQCFITNKEANHLLYSYIRLNNIKDTGSFARIEMPDLKLLLKREYIQARKLFNDSGVQWINAQYGDCYYNTLRDKNSVYPSALGEVVFSSGGKYFSIVMPGAIYMNGSWKLVSYRPGTGSPAQPSRVSYFIEQDELFMLHGMKPANNKAPVKPATTAKPAPEKPKN